MPNLNERPVVRIVLASAGIPLLLTAVAAGLLWSWRDVLPDPVARHWSGETADGFSSLTTVVILTVCLGLLFALIGAGTAAAAPDRRTARLAAATGAGLTGFVVTLITVSSESQTGLSDAANAQFSPWWIAVAVAAGSILALGCAALMPAWPAPQVTAPEDVEAVTLGQGERATWSRSVISGASTMVIVSGAVGLTVILAVLFQQWWMLAVGGILTALAAAMHSARVTVDQRGVTVQSRLRWPRFHTALADISHADVVEVHALRDFGGFGVRFSVMGPHKGTRGVVLRSGQAVRLTRIDGGRELVVVDDARTAVGVVNGLLQRASN